MSEPIRLVYLHQHFKSRQEAGGTRSFEFARRLAASGEFDVHLVAADTVGTRSREERMDGFTVHWVHEPYSNRMSFARRIRAFVGFAWKAGRRARALRPDLVFATSTPLTIILPAVRAARRGVPIVFEVRDLWPEMPIAVGALRGRLAIRLARRLERFAYRRSARIVALSPGIRDGIVAMGVPAERVSVIPNAADLDLFAPRPGMARAWRDSHPEVGDRPIVLYCGTLGLVNDVGYLVDIAAAAREIAPGIAFVVIGDGAERDSVRDRASALGLLGEDVLLLPPVPKNEVPLAFAAATVSTSLFAPIPEMEANSANKFFDGLASGTPVAIDYGGWQQELLESHDAGVRIPSGDPVTAAGMLIELIGEPERLARLGRNARALAERDFDRDALAVRLASVLREAHASGA